jgi:chemotaxis protein MotB
MSVADGADHRHEIIIVRRNHDDHDEGHHGGAWKIAFADFMTAMMCFFLVMWLINAANEQTKAAVASYFNPIRLVDRNAARKGLENLGDGPSSAGVSAKQPKEGVNKAGESGEGDPGTTDEETEKTDGSDSSRQAGKSDEQLFADPYAVLAEIATDTGVMQNVSSKGEGGAQAAGPSTGASGGQSYRDPFSPDFWSQQAASPGAEATAQRARIEGEPARPDDKTAEAEVPRVKALPPAPKSGEAPLEPPNETARDKSPPPAGTTGEQTGEAPKVASEAAPETENVEKKPSAATEKAAAAVEKQLAEAFKADKIGAGISAEATDKGVVISVTDQLDFGMFEIGSAMPSRELVLAMEKIGRIVNGQKGNVVIQGHTDARPFRSATYDNWRLSTARAHSAYYMLVRGGVDERRITEVAGFADREPKVTADPFAAANRRIEILLETDG